MMTFRCIVALLLVSSVAGAAFIPSHKNTQQASTTALHFGFLKELGIEKPSWLPDFGGKKEETPKAAKETEEEDAEATEAAVEE
jgi:hypothetical protein